MSIQPQRFGILVLPEHAEGVDPVTASEGVIRSAVVDATGARGASGYPRYVGDGVEADIDPETRTVEALLVDGAELGYGLTVRVVEATDV